MMTGQLTCAAGVGAYPAVLGTDALGQLRNHALAQAGVRALGVRLTARNEGVDRGRELPEV